MSSSNIKLTEMIGRLNGYYTNLCYNRNKEQAVNDINDMAFAVKFEFTLPLELRLIAVKDMIQRHISTFHTVSKHVDMIDTIMKTLSTCAMNFICEKNNDDLGDPRSTLLAILVTLFDVCEEPCMHSYLLYPLFAQSPWSLEDTEKQISVLDKIGLEVEMIIFKDADLYAVVYYLAYYLSENLTECQLWVQEEVKLKFFWILERHCVICKYCIKSFQSLNDIQYGGNVRSMRVLSIWSENILNARRLAKSSIHNMVFINCYMDWPNCFASLPYFDILRRLNVRSNLMYINAQIGDVKESPQVILYSPDVEKNFSSIYNLFYDGKWQKPKKSMYWKHKDSLWANATREDIVKCYTTAEKGFQIWSAKNVLDRLQVLSKLVPLLKTSGNLLLATVVERWTKFPYLYEMEQGIFTVTDNQIEELTETRMPLGVIIFIEKSEAVLFFRLIQNLAAGNVVIVLFDSRVSSLIKYYDMFSACGVPPGVVSFLSHENLDVLENFMCSMHYLKLITAIFVKTTGNKADSYIDPYTRLTMCKYILVNHGQL